MSPTTGTASARAAHTEYHPRWYRRRVSTYWWLGQWPYLKFTLRELSSIFVCYFVLLTLLQIRALARGPEAYAAFQARLSGPFWIALNGISFFFVVFHAVTWFNLAPRAMVVRLGGKRLPDIFVSAPNYIAWAVISLAVAWLILGG